MRRRPPRKILEFLEIISEVLRTKAESVVSELVKPFPIDQIKSDSLGGNEIEVGVVYEIAFDGNDSDAEILEKNTGLTLLGECDEEFEDPRPCIVTGNLTRKRNHIGRMY